MSDHLLPPLIGVAEAARLAGMHPDTFRRWLKARSKHLPDLLQVVGPKKWLVQVAALGAALGRSRLDLEALAVETAGRVDHLESRVSRLEKGHRS